MDESTADLNIHTSLMALEKENIVQRPERIRQKSVILVGTDKTTTKVAKKLAKFGIGKLIIFDHKKTAEQLDEFKHSLFSINPVIELECYAMDLKIAYNFKLFEDRIGHGSLTNEKVDLVIDCSSDIEFQKCINMACTDQDQKWLSCTILSALAGFIRFFEPGKYACRECSQLPVSMPKTNSLSYDDILPTTISILSASTVQMALKVLLEFGESKNYIRYDATKDDFISTILKPNDQCAIPKCIQRQEDYQNRFRASNLRPAAQLTKSSTRKRPLPNDDENDDEVVFLKHVTRKVLPILPISPTPPAQKFKVIVEPIGKTRKRPANSRPIKRRNFNPQMEVQLPENLTILPRQPAAPRFRMIGISKICDTPKSIIGSILPRVRMTATVVKILSKEVIYKVCREKNCRNEVHEEIVESPNGDVKKVYKCLNHDRSEKHASAYRARIRIADMTGTTEIVLLDAAESLFGITSYDMTQLRIHKREEYQKVVNKVLYKKFDFKILYQVKGLQEIQPITLFCEECQPCDLNYYRNELKRTIQTLGISCQ